MGFAILLESMSTTLAPTDVDGLFLRLMRCRRRLTAPTNLDSSPFQRIILLRPNLHIPSNPGYHLLPVGQVLAGFGRSNVPRAGGTHKLYRNVAHHLQRHIELFRLLNGAAQIVFRMQEERGSGDTSSMRQRRTLAIVILALRVPGIALGLQDLPEANI